MDLQLYLSSLGLILGVAAAAWLVSVAIRNVAFVDSLWPLFFLIAALTFAFSVELIGARGMLVTLLVCIWATRLSAHITARNWGEAEDYRYRAIRANNEPGFAFKSLFIVFGLQGMLAWIVALPLLPAITTPGGIGPLEMLAFSLWTVGFVFEAGGDYQLSKFRADIANKGRVLESGFWRYTRHPNYFGDFCVWWAFYLFAVAAGGWWTILSPLLMSFLLLRVSGVAMLEKTIAGRRPGYTDYIRRTNAFFPGLPRSNESARGVET